MHQKGYHLLSIQPNGNCMFNAFSRVYFGSPRMHRNVRLRAVNYIESHPDVFAERIVLDWKDEGIRNLQDYCSWMRKNGSWGDEHMLRAISEAYKCVLMVFIMMPNGEMATKRYRTSSCHSQTFHLAYDCSTEHYSAVVPIDIDTDLQPSIVKKRKLVSAHQPQQPRLRRSMRLQMQHKRRVLSSKEYCELL